jgi:protein SCO1/2
MRIPRWVRALSLASASGLTLGALGALGDEAPDMAPHAQHHADSQIVAATVQYTLPNVTLVRDDGASVSLPDEMNDGRPVLLNFIFTSCGSVCPLMSAMFAQFQSRLGADADKVHLMSISIDPEQDTPARLVEYAQKFGAGPGWQHYTGTVQASLTAQRAFDVYRGDKMNHTPVTFLRAGAGRRWVRLDGFASSDELAREVRDLVAAH